MEEQNRVILVVKRDVLLGEDSFEGFRPQNEINYESRIIANYTFMEKNLAENDSTYKQPIGYSMIVNPFLKKVFVYQRSNHDSLYNERRLQGKWSWGIGGHIDKIDAYHKNPVRASMLRELEEEVDIENIKDLKFIGYINNDSDDVGTVHFGILYVAETDSIIVKPKDSEIHEGTLRTIEDIEEICLSQNHIVEKWSRICLNPLREYFRKITC